MGRLKGSKAPRLHQAFCNYAAALLYYHYNTPHSVDSIIFSLSDFGAGKTVIIKGSAAGPYLSRDKRFEHSNKYPYEYWLKDEFYNLDTILELPLNDIVKDKVKNRPDRVEETAE